MGVVLGVVNSDSVYMCGVHVISLFLSSPSFPRNLFDLMTSFVTDLKSMSQSKRGEGVVAFPSAADLFIFYKKCLVQCASLSTGSPLLNLTTIFQKYLKEYATKILEGSLPK